MSKVIAFEANEPLRFPCVWGIFEGLPPMPKPIGKGAMVPNRRLDRDHSAVRHKGKEPARGLEYAERYGILSASNEQKRCPQCWKVKAYPSAFDHFQNCNECRELRATRKATERMARGFPMVSR